MKRNSFIIFIIFTALLSFAQFSTADQTVDGPQVVNINIDDAETIAKQLKGIGIKKAQAIVAYRNTYGPFSHVEELAEVKGIGAKMVKKLKNLVALD